MGFELPADPYPVCNCTSCSEDKALMRTLRSHYDGVGKDQEFTDEQYLLCPPRVLGFFMVKKTWAQLLVENVRDLKKENTSDAFSKLVMDHGQKNLIRSLVSRHGEDTEHSDGGSTHIEDIIEGKGKGIVILLHGKDFRWLKYFI